MILKRIGVIGAGVRGLGNTQTQHRVMLIDIRNPIFTQVGNHIHPDLRLSPLFNLPPELNKTPDELISQITFKTEYQYLHDVDFAVRDVFH